MEIIDRMTDKLTGKTHVHEPPPVVESIFEESEDKKDHISRVRREAVQMRWTQVKEDREQWTRPFHDLRIDKALEYLTDLQRIWEEGARIINDRMGNDKNIRCSGPKCGKDMSGLKPNGLPKWIAKKDFKDPDKPGLIRSLYFCSELCHNEWVRGQQGSGGTDGK
jgi:hypothetical protein